MSNVHEVRWRVLRARLDGILMQAPDGDELARLAALGIALLERHRVDHKGRCRSCRPTRGWWRRSRRCVVLPLMSWYLEQPMCWSARTSS